MLADAALAAVLPTLKRRAVHGPWSRAVAFRYLQGPPPGAPKGSAPQPLWPGGAPTSGARFTPVGAFPSLYLADNPIAALQETGGVLMLPGGTAVPVMHEPFVVLAVKGIVVEVLDLTDPDIQVALNTNDTELRGPWQRAQVRFLAGLGPMPPTQQLGLSAFGTGLLTGLQYPAAKEGDGLNFVVFTDRLATSPMNRLEAHDSSGHLRQSLP